METPTRMVRRMPEVTLDTRSGDAKLKLFHSRIRKKPSPAPDGKSSPGSFVSSVRGHESDPAHIWYDSVAEYGTHQTRKSSSPRTDLPHVSFNWSDEYHSASKAVQESEVLFLEHKGAVDSREFIFIAPENPIEWVVVRRSSWIEGMRWIVFYM
jgi:hypothetical protein